ncbi:sigma factor-like helix-turn-helix DNA-binding protein [Spiroplasma endosymbiont of Tipula paludosa]|jgi:ATP/maltotriose-dependent transcriptional regulator MalT
MNYAISYDTQYERTTVEQSYLVAEPKWINYGLSFLTKLENEVILLKSQDYSNEEISHKLNISYKSVDNAYQRAKVKLQKNRDCM